MANLFRRLKNALLGPDEPPLSDAEEERLRLDFRARYQAFKQLLAANNRALELMSEMEAAREGRRVFGMSFIRSRATSLGVAVYQMVDNLNRLAPDKYRALFERLDAIQAGLDQVLRPTGAGGGGKLVMDLGEVGRADADRAGAKMANLGELARLPELMVPPGFVITARAYAAFMEHNRLAGEIARLQQAADLENAEELFVLSSRLGQLIVNAELPPELAAEMDLAYGRLAHQAGARVRVSLRSSALGEDAAEASFAGQYATRLNVDPEFLAQEYKEVVASKYTPQAMRYRLLKGIPDEQAAMAVGCLSMVPAVSGGVLYTVNPLDGADRDLRVTAAWGLPKAVVDGQAATDLFVVSRQEPREVRERIIRPKESEFVCRADDGVCQLQLTGERGGQPCIKDQDAVALAEIGLALEEHYGGPQDIEWALDREGRLWILQCRPLTPARGGAVAISVEGLEPLISGGVTASPGAAAGPVHWVVKDSDALTFPRGAILATPWPAPRWAALLDKAAAVLAQEGSPAGHLATVAREFRVPALFSLGGGLKGLADGQEVTVSADGRAVYPGRVEALLSAPEPAHGAVAHSPVMTRLGAALELIAPLHFLDPDSRNFAPAKAATLHDITRFCHEMAVREMFAFGREHSFPQRSSKQLHFKVPMQWWVLNLDDGFSREVTGKYVHLEDIASGPMLALWEGMLAVPWQGPPAVSGRGLASVMFQATANPSLTTGVKTRYAQKNYFMVARDFVNLQSRFGFHFTGVESMAGPRRRENYLSFSFKGGAADLARREARVNRVAKVLERAGFQTRLVVDSLAARADGREEHDMLTLLKVVGYLIIHTRQLDMIMGEPARADAYFQEINRHVDAFLNGDSAGA